MEFQYVHKSFRFKIRHNLSFNCKDVESHSIENSSNTVRNTLFNVPYVLELCTVTCFSSFIQGSNFPDKLKITRVTTIFKRGNEWDMDNYRPMSFLYRASQKC